MSKEIPISNAEALQLLQQPNPATKEFIFQQTMYRIKDPKVTVPFYSGVLGMSLLQKLDFPEMKFTLYFMGYEDPVSMPGELGSKKRSEWALSRPATVELTHNWGTENQGDFKYHTGNSEPKGFGHIGVMVPDVEKACERFEQLNVHFIKRPQDGKMKTIAFITDPDGYWIEIFSNKGV